MNSRLDNDKDNGALTKMLKLQQDVNDLKSRQSINRALIKRSFITVSAKAIDLSAYSVPANTVHYFHLTFTGNGTQLYPYGVQYSQIYEGGSAPANRLSDYQVLSANGAHYFWYPSASYAFQPNAIQWIIGVGAGSTAASFYIKIRTMTTCAGNWTLT